MATTSSNTILETAEALRWQIGQIFHEQVVEDLYTEAARLADRVVTRPVDQGARRGFDLDRVVDRVVTSRVWGFPLMLLLFAVVFWITIAGANIPSGWLATLFLDWGHAALKSGVASIGLPWWLDGLLIDGVYLATAWVVSVMLPPMAMFFPLLTLLEDLGYLPRVAFNLDSLFKKSGAHGKQALSMMMGFGCNAAGIISALAVVGVAVLGIWLTFVVSWGLSRSVLRGEVSTFSLELPPYRPPRRLAHRLHVGDRPHAVCPVAGGCFCHAGRGRHLADRQRVHRGGQPGRTFDRRA